MKIYAHIDDDGNIDGISTNESIYPVEDFLVGHEPWMYQVVAGNIVRRSEPRKQNMRSLEYWQKRVCEYPPVQELADALYWKEHGDPSKWAAYMAKVQAVKEKYPKSV